MAHQGTVGPLLEAEGLSAGYGGHAVVWDIDLSVGRGEIVGLLGANGAGKTTTLMALAGALPSLSGEVLLQGTVERAPLHVRARRGLCYVTEQRSVFMGLSVTDNLRAGQVRAADVVETFPELQPLLSRLGGQLSGGEQQMLTLGRALARRPKLLLADELSLGLAPLVVVRLLDAVRRAADTTGVGVLLVEQHVQQLLRVADRVYVMKRGRVVFEGSAAEMRERAGGIEGAYLSGGDVA